jgi:hypothetical protein
VQAIGELDQEHADVVGDRQQQLAQVLGLLCFARDQLQPFQLGEPLDQRADLVTEDVVDLGARRLGILDGVMQQGSYDGGVVELEVGQDRRDLERMGKIGIAGRARLRAMRLHGVDIGAVEQVFVGVGVIRPDPLDQIVLPHHARAWRFRLLRHRRRRRDRDLTGCGLHLPGVAAPIRHHIIAFFHQTRTGPAIYVSNAFSDGDARRSGRETVQFRLGQRPSNALPGARPARRVSRFRPRRPRTHCNRKNVNKSKGPNKCPGL